MRPHGCPFESRVVAAAREGSWSDTLRVHLAECSNCAEAAFVAETLLLDARRAMVEDSLPDPTRIWLEATLRTRRLLVARATRPIVIVRTVAVALGAAFAAVSATSLLPDLGRWLAWLRPPASDLISRVAFLHGVLLIVASCAFMVFAAYALLVSLRDE